MQKLKDITESQWAWIAVQACFTFYILAYGNWVEAICFNVGVIFIAIAALNTWKD
jgi:hypothetical protein